MRGTAVDSSQRAPLQLRKSFVEKMGQGYMDNLVEAEDEARRLKIIRDAEVRKVQIESSITRGKRRLVVNATYRCHARELQPSPSAIICSSEHRVCGSTGSPGTG